MAYQKASTELERLTRLVKAYEWTLAVEKTSKMAEEVKRKQKELKQREAEVKTFRDEIVGMESDVKDIQKKRDKEMTKGGKVQGLQKTVDDLDREITKLKAQLEMDVANLQDERTRVTTIHQTVKDVSF